MSNERYVAAIEVSSSKIMAVVGKIADDGSLEIVASEQERGVEGVRYGIVQNLEETSTRIARIIDRLQRKPGIAPHEITGVFVGLSGRSLHSITTSVTISLPVDTEINDEILDRLQKQANATPIDNSLTIADAIPRLYTIGKYETNSPKGVVGNGITAIYDLIVCRPEMRRNLQRTLTEKTGISINGYLVTALATAQTILTSQEKRQGCMLIDMGAETTTVSIYKDGHLNYFATLPMGGRNITRDITSLTLLEEKAEDIKLTSGNALQRDGQSSLNMGGVKMSEVSNYIVARAEEIVANIIEQISYADMKENQLLGGIICIGGGSKLNGILDLLATRTGLPVRRGQLPQYIAVNDSRIPEFDLLQAASILYAGASNSTEPCLTLPVADDLPAGGTANPAISEGEAEKPRKPRKPSIWSKIGSSLTNMFSGPAEDDSDLLE